MASSKRFMQRAIDLARAGMIRGDGGPFGAVVVSGTEIVGEGWNQVLSTNDPTAHGEVTAIRDACTRLGEINLQGCEIYTTGEPCPMCLGAILWARLDAIHFGFRIEDAALVGFDDRQFFQQMALPSIERSIPASELCRNDALALIAEYAALPNKRHY